VLFLCCSFDDAFEYFDDSSFTEKVGLKLAARHASLGRWGWDGHHRRGCGACADVSDVGETTQQQCRSKQIDTPVTKHCRVAGFMRGAAILGSCCHIVGLVASQGKQQQQHSCLVSQNHCQVLPLLRHLWLQLV
jgi:hypothetical protein